MYPMATLHYTENVPIACTQTWNPDRYCAHFWDEYPYPDRDHSLVFGIVNEPLLSCRFLTCADVLDGQVSGTVQVELDLILLLLQSQEALLLRRCLLHRRRCRLRQCQIRCSSHILG